jgi:hypothetical protein
VLIDLPPFLFLFFLVQLFAIVIGVFRFLVSCDIDSCFLCYTYSVVLYKGMVVGRRAPFYHPSFMLSINRSSALHSVSSYSHIRVSSSNFSNSYLNALSIVITPCMITPPTRGSNRCIPHSCVLHGMRRHHYIGHTLLCLTHRSPFLSCRLLLVDSLLYL